MNLVGRSQISPAALHVRSTVGSPEWSRYLGAAENNSAKAAKSTANEVWAMDFVHDQLFGCLIRSNQFRDHNSVGSSNAAE
jgi:hypothetical protein